MSWPLVAIKDVARVITGKTPSKSEEDNFGGEIPFVTPAELNGSAYVSYTPQTITEKGASKLKLVPRNSVMVCCIGSLGKLAIADREVATNQQINSVVFDAEKVNPKYGYYALSKLKPIMEKLAPSTTVAIINKSNFEALEIPLPPLAEQKRIAAILDKADAIRRKRQQAIQLADDFLRAVFLDMFGDPVTNPKGWDQVPFSSVGSLDRGKSKHRPRNDPALLGGDHPLIQTGEVANCRGYIREFSATYSDLGLAQSRKWSAGTLCITIAANIAKTGILTFPACFPDSVVGFQPNERVTVEYVQHWLRFLQKNLEENAPQAAQKNINLEILRNLLIPVPKKSVQEKFSSIVSMVTAFEEKIATSGEELGDVFSSLSQKAFRGEL